MREKIILEELFKTSPSLESIEVKVPGKLYISGEYAILFPKQPAVLIAVDQYLHAYLKATKLDTTGHIQTNLSDLETLNFSINEGRYVFSTNHSEGWHYVINAMIVVNDLLHAMQIDLKHFDLSFNSNLVHDNGVKLGLGSSGAVVVATIRSILAYHDLEACDNQTIFKLAAIALTRSHSKGSLGDVATITHGGWVYYQSFDRQWLKDCLQEGVDVAQLVIAEWPDLIIETIQPSQELVLLIGWTQSAASTEDLVGDLLKQVDGDSEFFKHFLAQSKRSVNRLKDALLSQHIDQVQKEINHYRQLLQNLGQHYHLNIETPLLTQLIESAQTYGFASKSSGAGGGDSGIAIGSKDLANSPLIDSWIELGILNLPLQATATY